MLVFESVGGASGWSCIIKAGDNKITVQLVARIAPLWKAKCTYSSVNSEDSEGIIKVGDYKISVKLITRIGPLWKAKCTYSSVCFVVGQWCSRLMV